MAKRYWLFCFFILILSLNLVSASEIQNFSIEIQIINSKALVDYAMGIDTEQIAFILPDDARITDIIGAENYSLNEGILAITGLDKTLKIEYVTSSFIEKATKNYFTADFKLPYQAENLSVSLILPESSVLKNAYPFPELTSDGRHIILKWGVSQKKDFPVFVIYTEKKESWPWLIIISIAIMAVLFAIFRKRKPKAKTGARQKKMKKVEIHLLESESAVMNALNQAKGELWQKQIQLKTGFSKAKLSRVIRNLEARGLVKRIPLGNTNKIKLK